MGYNIGWDNEDRTVVFQGYDENPTKADLYQLAEQSARMLATVEHTVHLIVDEWNVTHVIDTRDMAYLEKLLPKNQGAVVVIMPRRRMGYKIMLQKLAKSVAPKAFSAGYFVESLEEARQLLREKYGVQYPVELMRHIG